MESHRCVGENFCGLCGRRLHWICDGSHPGNHVNPSVRCGARNDADHTYCSRCGSPKRARGALDLVGPEDADRIATIRAATGM